MSVQEVLASRRAIGERIIRNIRDYGTPDGKEPLLERPYNGLSAMKYPFTGANYLRILSVHEEDPRWYRCSSLRKEGYQVSSYAPTVELESWTNLDKGIRSATARLEKYVNARYVRGLPSRELPALDKGENLDRATRLLRCAEETAKNREFTYPKGRKDLFYRFVHASRRMLEKEIGEQEAARSPAPPLMAYLAFKTAGLSMEEQEIVLFSESQMAQFRGKDGPGKLFQAMGRASSMLNRIQAAELTLFDEFIHEGRGEYFQDLRVTLHYSEARELTGGVHNGHPDEKGTSARVHNGHLFQPGVYKQEAAYELLSAMIRVDKERWEKNLGKHELFGRTKISMAYGSFQIKEAVINLGQLELGNKSTVSQALEGRLPREAKRELKDEEALRLHLFRYDRTLEENSEAVRQRKEELEAFIQECHGAVLGIRESEEQYLCSHEAQRKELEQRAPTYLYYYQDSWKVPDATKKPYLLGTHYVKDALQDAVVDSPKKGNTVFWLSPDGVIVESAWPMRDEAARPIFTPEEVKDFRNLDKFSIAYREEGKPFTKEMPVVRGEKAMEFFLGHKLEDASMAAVKNHPKEYEVGVKMEFSYDGKPFYSIRYTEGSGDLNRKLPVGMPHLENPKEDREFQKAVHTWAKYHNRNRLDACTLLYSKSWVPIAERRAQKKQAVEQSKNNLQKVAEKAAYMGR